jgi:hypothetical protein
MRNALIIIPISKPQYQWNFSAPLGWIFAGYPIKSKYSCHIQESDMVDHDFFIVELNWVTEIYEVIQLSRWIKRVNPKAQILIGGIFSSIHYKELLRRGYADIFIKGFNELPMKMFLDGVEIKDIPNITTRDFDNPVTYVFKTEDWMNIEFDLSWNPLYEDYRNRSGIFHDMTWEEYGGVMVFNAPVIPTSRAGCAVAHAGCEWCVGSSSILPELYRARRVTLDNNGLIYLLEQIKSKGFKQASMIVMTELEDFDLTGKEYDFEFTIEFDCRITSVAALKRVIDAFKGKLNISLPFYTDGSMGGEVYPDEMLLEINAMNSDRLRVVFMAYSHVDQRYRDMLGNNLCATLEGWITSLGDPSTYLNLEQSIIVSKQIWNRVGPEVHQYIPESQTLYLVPHLSDI